MSIMAQRAIIEEVYPSCSPFKTSMGIHERKEREKSRKREVILKAAEKVFFKNGFENTTMDEIAQKAEYSKGTLYLYFKNKDELYAAIMLRSIDIFIKIINQEISKAKGGREKLAAIKTAYLKFYINHPDHMKVFLFASTYIFRMQNEKNNEIMDAIVEKDKIFKGIISSIIDAARRDGTVKEMGISGNTEEIFQAGGLVLNGIFKNIIDLETVFTSFQIKPENAVELAYRILRF